MPAPTLFPPFCAHCAPGSKSPCRLYDSHPHLLLLFAGSPLATCGNSHPHALAPIRYLRSHPPRRRAADGPSGYGELLLRRGEPRRRSPRRRRRRRQSRLRSLRRGRPLPPLPWRRRVHADRGTEPPPSTLKVLPICSVGSVVRGAGASSQQLGPPALRPALATARSRRVLSVCLFADRCCRFVAFAEDTPGQRGLVGL